MNWWKSIIELAGSLGEIFYGSITQGIVKLPQTIYAKSPWNIILHVGTNSYVNETSNNVLGKILYLKQFIKEHLRDSKVIFSNVIERLDDSQAVLVIKRLNEDLRSPEIDVIGNSNIGKESFGKTGFHQHPRVSGKLAMNFINKNKNLHKNWHNTGSFQKNYNPEGNYVAVSLENLENSAVSETIIFQNCEDPQNLI